MSNRFIKIEQDVVDDHSHLKADDECYYFLEYTSGQDYNFGKANSFISNLKKPVRFRDLPSVWRYKTDAIRTCSKDLGEAIDHRWLQAATLVPVPPSKVRTDPDYDDRMLRILQGINLEFAVNVRELVIQKASLRASHGSTENRVTLQELLDVYQIDDGIAEPVPEAIGIVDDILTAGTHYRAMETVLSARYPGVSIVGFFIARRVFPPDPVEFESTE